MNNKYLGIEYHNAIWSLINFLNWILLMAHFISLGGEFHNAAVDVSISLSVSNSLVAVWNEWCC